MASTNARRPAGFNDRARTLWARGVSVRDIYIDTLFVTIRFGSVVSMPVYLVVGVDMNGRKDVLGVPSAPTARGATTWVVVLTARVCVLDGSLALLVLAARFGLADAV